MRNYENVYCRKAKCCERDCQYSGGYEPKERVSGGERVLCDVDVRAFVHIAGTGGVYREMAEVESGGFTDDSIEVPHPTD